MSLSERHSTVLRPIRIIEVGPRDGLQNESDIVSTEAKVSFVDGLSETGVTEIEAGSFVSPRAIPQLADSDEVFRMIPRRPGVIYSALVPNERGLERARAASGSGARASARAGEAPRSTQRKRCGARCFMTEGDDGPAR